MTVDWGYVAGFLDGEGWVSFHGEKSWPYWNIGCCQSTPQDACLYAIQAFLQEHGITSKLHIAKPNGPRRHPISKLYINGDRVNKILFLTAILPRLIVKRSKAQECLRLLKVLPYKKRTIDDLCHAYARYCLGSNMKSASKSCGIGHPTLVRFMRENGLPGRTKSESMLMFLERSRCLPQTKLTT